MSDYATVAEIKAFAQEPDALDDAYWAILATAASRMFDNLTEVAEDTYQAAAADPSTKVFVGDGTAYLKLPPFVALADTDPIVIDGNNYTVPDYTVAESMLIIIGAGAALVSGDPYRYGFFGWRENIKITVSARWGFATIPADVKFAVIQIALLMWRQSDPSFGGISNAEGSLLVENLPALAGEIVNKYRDKYSQRRLFG